jgi:hypothetical protein
LPRRARGTIPRTLFTPSYRKPPSAKIGLLANASLRVEPYATTYPIVPHE